MPHVWPCRVSRHSITVLRREIASITMLLAMTIGPLAAQNAQTELPENASPSGQSESSETANKSVQEYTGPAVLSRDNQPSLGQEATLMLQPFFYVNEIYDTGLAVTSGAMGASGQGVAGVEAGFGLRGTHHWKRMILNVNYEGNFRQYSQQTGTDGTNQYLRATALIQLRRHVELALRQTVASVIQDVGSLSLQPLNSFGTLPASEPFDNRAKLFDSQATLTYQKSRRLSFTSTVGTSRIQRDLAPLVGTDVIMAAGDVGYLLSRHATVGFDYNFSHYGYTTFGSANLSTVSGNFGWRLSRTVDLGVQLGMSHGEVTGLAIVPLDPDVAAIVGVSNGIEVLHQVLSTPALRARISKHWRSSSADLEYQKGISPGNGLVLTSESNSVNGGFHYTPSRIWTLSMQAGRTSMQALSGLNSSSYASSYTGYVTDVSISRTIRPNVQIMARFDARPFSYVGTGLQTRIFYRTTIGFIFTPREMPVVLR